MNKFCEAITTFDTSWVTQELFIGIMMNVIGLCLLAAVIVSANALKDKDNDDDE